MQLRLFVLAIFLMSVFTGTVYCQYIEWENRTPTEMKHDGWILQTAFLQGGRQLVSAGLDGRIRIWDSQTGKQLKELSATNSIAVLAIAVSAEGKWIAGGDSRGKISIWDPIAEKMEKQIQGDARQVNALSVSCDGKLLAAGGSEGVIRIFSTDNWNLMNEISPDKGRIVSLVFSPDSKMLTAGSLDPNRNKQGGEIEVWRWKSKEKIHGIQGAPAVRGLAISPDGRFLAGFAFKFATRLYLAVHGDNQIKAALRVLRESDEPGYLAMWDLASGERIATVEAELGSTSLAFSPDSRLLALAGSHGMLLYAFQDSRLLEKGRLESQTPIDSVCFSPNGNSLLLARRLPIPERDVIKESADPFYITAVNISLQGEPSSVGLKKNTTSSSKLELWRFKEPDSPFASAFWKAYLPAIKGEVKTALSAFEKLADEYPDETEIFRILSILNAKNGKAEKAIEILETAGNTKPEAPMLYRTLGDLLSGSREWEKAIEAYKKALELDPEFGLVRYRLYQIHANWAMSMFSSDRAKLLKCAALLEEAIRFVADDGFVYSQAGVVQYLLQNYDGAIEYLHQALELQPDYARAYYNLGHCYRDMGNSEKAIEAYQYYIDIGEKGEEARVERARMLIESLKK